jgi:hypothetical protein
MSEEQVERVPVDSESFRLQRNARISARLGIIAMGLSIFGVCTGGISLFLALALAVLGALFAFSSYSQVPRKTASRAYAKVGIITNLTAGICSLALLCLMSAYFGFCTFCLIVS